MIHSSKSEPDEILSFAHAYGPLCQWLGRRPLLVCVPTTYNTITEAELVACGFNIIIHANHMLRAAYKAMSEVARTILMSGRSLETGRLIASVAEIFTSVGYDRIIRMDQERLADQRLAAERFDGVMPLRGRGR